MHFRVHAGEARVNMTSHQVIDGINTKTMRNVVGDYSWQSNLTPAEIAALKSLPDIKGESILDIGVGGGRTVLPLLEISRDYTGVDYVHEMVEMSRSRYPDVRFVQADARDLSAFESGSFYMIMFSANGISMVNHEGRLAILREVRRLLKPGGVFLFSTYNLNDRNYGRLFQLPDFELVLHPVKSLKRSVRFVLDLVSCIINRLRYKKLERHFPEYSMINDRCHNYATMLYYITVENMKKQLLDMGFSGDVSCFGKHGELVDDAATHNSIFYAVRA